MKMYFSALELDWNDCWTGDYNRIDSASKSRNIKLKEDPAFEFDESLLEKLNGFLPRDLLWPFQVEVMRESQDANQRIRTRVDEFANRSPVVGGYASVRLYVQIRQ